MNAIVTHPATEQRSVITDMALRFGMERAAFVATLKATVVPANISNEQFAAFCLVAKEYNLNPITKELYAFPTNNGGIQPIVSIDGWMKIINSHPQFDGMEFEDHIDAAKITAVTCRIYRKDRRHPIAVTEYMSECARGTEPWKRWPARMLRHKAAIQCARYAFGFSGIVDPDEAERIREVESVRGEAIDAEVITEPTYYPEADFDKKFDTWVTLIESGKKTADDIIAMVESKAPLTDDMKAKLRGVKPQGESA